MRGRGALLLALALASGLTVTSCAGTDPAGTCDAVRPCPAGQSCSEGWCIPRLLTPIDAGMVDASVPALGCASGVGSAVGDGVYGCLGMWPRGGVAALCAAGFALCEGKPSEALDRARCDAAPGFFLLVRATSGGSTFCPDSGYRCDASSGFQKRSGCGATLPDPKYFSACDTSCYQLNRALPCTISGRWGYVCDLSDPRNDSNTNSSLGVLCCKM